MPNIKHSLFRIPFIKQSLILIFSILFCISILFYRIHISGIFYYDFMLWNLLLAIIPYCFSILVYQNFRHHCKKSFYVLFVLLWLLFYPNAPYIITDIMHFMPDYGVPAWIDILMLFSFAWTGLILGFASLRMFHIVFENNLGRIWGWLFVISVIILGSFGVFLGRYLRFNSYDLFTKPRVLFIGVHDVFLNPHLYPGMYGMTIFFSLFFFLAYLSIIFFMFPNKKTD
jgi:uncharacterized membrane protein